MGHIWAAEASNGVSGRRGAAYDCSNPIVRVRISMPGLLSVRPPPPPRAEMGKAQNQQKRLGLRSPSPERDAETISRTSEVLRED